MPDSARPNQSATASGGLGALCSAAVRACWRSYFRPRGWEGSGEPYERLGVRRIKEFYFGGRYPNALVSALLGRRYRPFRGAGWPRRWLRFTVGVEIGHSLIGVYMLAATAGQVAVGDWWGAGGTMVLDILVNGYPVLIQRYNRIRLLRLFDRGTEGDPEAVRT